MVRRVFRLLVLLALLIGGFYAWRERARWLPFAQDLKSKWWDRRGEDAGNGGPATRTSGGDSSTKK